MKLVSQWALRLKIEGNNALQSVFTTLTYNTENVPITKNGFMSLDLSDIQRFFKRLRKAHHKKNDVKIKYFLVAEYGTKRLRPHYHAIIFNCAPDLIVHNWTSGQVHNGTVSGPSIAYTLKYMLKKGQIPKHKNDDRKKEFRTMSKGLGEGYLTKQAIKLHRSQPERRFVITEGGFKVPLPRYYLCRIFSDSEIKKQNIQINNQVEQQKQHHEKKFQQNNPKTQYASYVEYQRAQAEERTKRSQRISNERGDL